MDPRTTRAQERAAAIDVSPAKLAAEVERLTRERDLARRQVELARQELARIAAGGPIGGDGPRPVGPTAAPSRGRTAAPASNGPSAAELQKERDEFLTQLQRERAEFTNYKRRTAEEREAMAGLAAEGLIRKVLAVADDFDLAIEHRPATGVEDGWVEGVVAIERKLRQLLESEGVAPIEAAAGMPFDPREHEAIVNVPNTRRRGGEIVEELRRGYRLGDRVIRPALVAVADHDTAPETTNEPTTESSNEQ